MAATNAQTSQQWRNRALSSYAEAQRIESEVPGSQAAVELYARAGTEAQIAVAFAVRFGVK